MMKNHEKTAIIAAWYSIISNTILALIKWLVGYYGHSYALIADAIESTSDIFSSLIVLLGIKYSSRPANIMYPYGYGKAEPLVAFLAVGFLCSSAGIIFYNSIINIFTPHETPKPYTLYVLAVIIVWKEISFRIVQHNANKSHSSSLKADAWHHRSDAITSLAAFCGILIAIIFGKGYENADDWAALIAVFIILYNAYLIFSPALWEIMDKNLYDDLVTLIRVNALKVEGIKNTEKCYIRKSGMKYHVDIHVRVDGNMSVRVGHDIAHKLKNQLLKEIPYLGNILVHIEPE